MSINLLMRFVLLSRPASFCGSSPALQQGSFHTGLGLRGFPAAASSYIFWRDFLVASLWYARRLASSAAATGVGFRLGFQFLVGVLLAVPAGFKAFRFLRREWLACVQCGGKLFQRPGLGRLCRFLTLIPCLCWRFFFSRWAARRSASSGVRSAPAFCSAASSFKDFGFGGLGGSAAFRFSLHSFCHARLWAKPRFICRLFLRGQQAAFFLAGKLPFLCLALFLPRFGKLL